jgi:protein O-mannosyl-transferase
LAVPGAWFAAALFAVHPVHVESVAWITERKNVLSLLFYLLSLRAWLGFIEEPPKGRWRHYALALGFNLLALFSKTTACTLPAALGLLLWLRHRPITRARLLEIVPFAALGLAMGLLTMWWERYHQGTAGSLFAFSWLDRLLIASRAAWFYAGKLLWPVNLTFSYPRWTINSSDPLAYAWLAAGVGLVVVILLLRRWVGRGVEAAAAFYLATLSPLLGFIMLYTFRYSFVADHYQYVASIGPLALVAAGLTRGLGLLRKTSPLAPALCCALLLLVLGALTWRQCGMYATAETLYRTTVTRNPASFMAHNNLGTALLRRGQTDEAIAQFQEVLRLQPDYEVAYYNLGLSLLRQGRQDEALAQLEKAVALKPDYAAAHNNLANLFLRKGQPRDAIAHYQLAARFRPKNADIANNLAWLLATCPEASLRNGAQAVELAQKAERLSVGREPVFIATLAAAYAETGRFSDAVLTGQRALQLASRQRNAALATALSKQLALYQAGLPFRDAVRTNPSPGHDLP